MSKHNGPWAWRAAMAGALACVIGAASAGAAKAQEAQEDPSLVAKFMDVLGLKKDGPGIVYRERSPLVIPLKRELPQPERASVESNPAWPVDPEVKAKKEADALGQNSSSTFDEEARALRPDQMTPGRRFNKKSRVQRSTTAANAGSADVNGNDSARPLRPSELGYTGGLFGMFKGSKEEEIGKFTSEPPRASLTDPPAGYQTPSNDAPYGLGKDRTPIKPGNYLLDHGTQQN